MAQVVANANGTHLHRWSSQKSTVATSLERNMARPKTTSWAIPNPIVVKVHINGQVCKALLDMGSLADFISTTCVDQLKLPVVNLTIPLPVQLAITGSRSLIHHEMHVKFEFQLIQANQHFDITNLYSYDIVLGTPFFYQFLVVLGFNPSQVVIGASEPLEICGNNTAIIPSCRATLVNENLELLWQQLRDECTDLYKSVDETPLPPLWDLNHKIPLIDKDKVFKSRCSTCPKALHPLWNLKRDSMLQTGQWEYYVGPNAAPMLILKKKPGPNGEIHIRTVIDKHDQNSNTVKMASPLPDIQELLDWVAHHPYCTVINGHDAYEQIHVHPPNVNHNLLMTPDGMMQSLVMLQGDYNSGATFQLIMVLKLAPYIGVFVDVYLNDIIIYSDSIEDHMEHCHTIFSILQKEKFYLTTLDKLQCFTEKLNILGHIIDHKGIMMDPNKVDSIDNWKVPTNASLLHGFLGAAGYLTPSCKNLHKPMGILTPISGHLMTST
jgi:Reverse transcriptase (RNA-dependent DNA polymerase)/Retroviral aspartyl protease